MAQPEELPLESSSLLVLKEAAVVLPGEPVVLAQQLSPRVWPPEPWASPGEPQAVLADERSGPGAA